MIFFPCVPVEIGQDCLLCLVSGGYRGAAWGLCGEREQVLVYRVIEHYDVGIGIGM